jgi:hypothetical protein
MLLYFVLATLFSLERDTVMLAIIVNALSFGKRHIPTAFFSWNNQPDTQEMSCMI